MHFSDSDYKADMTKQAKVVIGIGCSAGGLDILRQILSKVKRLEDAAIVIVQHLSFASKSMLTDILSRDTDLPVLRAEAGTEIKPNNVYVALPKTDITVKDGKIVTNEIKERATPKPSIDTFFASLSESYAANAVAVVLSGTGRDGSYGLKAVKAAGGIVIAQEPVTAQYDGMPEAAIATNLVDFIWSPATIAENLSDIQSLVEARHQGLSEQPERSSFEVIFRYLKEKTKIDFSLYKAASIERRLMRRMFATGCDSLSDYAKHLEQSEEEINLLFNDMLISVTSFFRDEAEFDALAREFKKYCTEHHMPGSLRIWCAGCSTGEEAYSIAIMIYELQRTFSSEAWLPDIQIFATDIQEDIMAEARRGLFSEATTQNLPRHIRDRYFDQTSEGMEVKKKIRELVLFAKHDLTRNPPFMRIDLVVCRNVFIYFEQEIQEKIINVFHYALKPNGILFMGKSESIATKGNLFEPIDPKAKIYQKLNTSTSSGFAVRGIARGSLEASRKMKRKQKNDDSQLDVIVRAFAPNAIVLSEDLNVISLLGGAKALLKFPEGNVDYSLDTLLQDEFKAQVSTLVHRAKRSKETCELEIIDPRQLKLYSANTDTKIPEVLTIKVVPLSLREQSLFIVTIANRSAARFTDRIRADLQKDIYSSEADLENELAATREHLQTVIEEQETANEELQALNEEMQSANEELQSTNEELETSNEELQSTNEELTTVNEELNSKTAQLNELFTYVKNIHYAIPVPAIVIDEGFALKRFNPAASQLLSLNDSHLNRNLRYLDFPLDLTNVWLSVEEAVKKNEAVDGVLLQNKGYIQFYCRAVFIGENIISAIVITFIDNTKLYEESQHFQRSFRRLNSLIDSLKAPISVKNANGHYELVNEAFSKLAGKPSDKIIGKDDEAIFGASEGQIRRNLDYDLLKTKGSLAAEELFTRKEQKPLVLQTLRTVLSSRYFENNSIGSVGLDITNRDFSEKQLRNFESFLQNNHDCFMVFEEQENKFVLSFGDKLIRKLLGNQFTIELGQTLDSFLLQLCDRLSPEEITSLSSDLLAEQSKLFNFERHLPRNEVRYYSLKSILVSNEDPTQLLLTISDKTSENEHRMTMQSQQEDLLKTAKMASLGEMAAGIAHELKTPLNTIQGYVDLINTLSSQSEESALQPPVAEAVSNIENTVERISEIIVGLKSITKNRDKDAFKPAALREIIDEVLKLSSFHLKNRGVSMRADSVDDISIDCRPTQISQVLINLINNGADAVQEVENRWVSIKVRKIHEDKTVEILVSDSGKGMPDSIANQIMTPFFTTKSDGTGLGLSLSRNIMRTHGGDLELLRGQKHTTFRLTLPIYRGSKEN